MTYKHCSTVRGPFHHIFSDCVGIIEKSLKFLPLNRVFHAILDKQAQMAIVFNHAPQLLFANTEVNSCLSHGQGILLTNPHIILFQILISSFLVPYHICNRENPIFRCQGSRCSECIHRNNSFPKCNSQPKGCRKNGLKFA